MRVIRFVIVLIVLLSGLAPTPIFAAEKFPSRPIKFVVGFAAGGPNDTVARIMCEWLAPRLGQPCIVEDRAGSGGMIAAQEVINSPPDGYTIMFVAPNDVIGNSLYKNLPFVFLRDSAPVAGMMRLTNVMVVPPSLGVSTVAEFIALAKARPGELHYASSGNGTSVHMSAELFKMMTQLNMVHVPYRGSAAVYPDLWQVGSMCCSIIFQARSDSLKPISYGRSRSRRLSARLCCPTSQPSLKRCQATRQASSTGFLRLSAHRPK